MMQLSKLGRRFLAHVPVWAADEDAFVAAEGGPEVSVRSYTLPEFTARLAEDPDSHVTYDFDGHARKLPHNEEGCQVGLEALVADGLIKRSEIDVEVPSEEETAEPTTVVVVRYGPMTKAGLDLLLAPDEDEDQTPGAVFINTHPAKFVTDAQPVGKVVE